MGTGHWCYNTCLTRERKSAEVAKRWCRHGPRSNKLQGRCLARCAQGPRAGRHLLLGGRRRQPRGRRRPGLELLPPQHVPGAAEAQFHQLPPHLFALREGKDGQGARLPPAHGGRAPPGPPPSPGHRQPPRAEGATWRRGGQPRRPRRSGPGGPLSARPFSRSPPSRTSAPSRGCRCPGVGAPAAGHGQGGASGSRRGSTSGECQPGAGRRSV